MAKVMDSLAAADVNGLLFLGSDEVCHMDNRMRKVSGVRDFLYQ